MAYNKYNIRTTDHFSLSMSSFNDIKLFERGQPDPRYLSIPPGYLSCLNNLAPTLDLVIYLVIGSSHFYITLISDHTISPN